MLEMMIIDLVQFVILWVIILLTFTCVGQLLFNQLPKFNSFVDVFFMYFDSSLGSWDPSVYNGRDIFGDPMNMQTNIGMVFLAIFLLINLVLLLNFVIALLSGTFSNYEDKQLGLYYEVIVAMFPVMEYDNRYGSIVCAQTPFNLMILPF